MKPNLMLCATATLLIHMAGYAAAHGESILKSRNDSTVSALGIIRKTESLPFNIQTISHDRLNTVPDANFINTLTGKTASLYILSGAAGAGSATRATMRGMRFVRKNNSPMYVIDGIPMFNTVMTDMGYWEKTYIGTEYAADFSPEDIESVSILSGPAASALYGSDGVNGIIMINTRKGENGRLRVNVSSSTLFSDVLMMPELQYRYGDNESSWSNSLITGQESFTDQYFKTSFCTMNTVSVSGGTEQHKAYISFSSANSDNIVPAVRYNRYSATLRTSSEFAKGRIKLDLGANYINQDDRNMLGSGIRNNPLTALYLMPRGASFSKVRTFEKFDSDLGIMVQDWPFQTTIQSQNPYWTAYRTEHRTGRNRYILNAGLSISLTSWLGMRIRGNGDFSVFRNNLKYHATTTTENQTWTGYYGSGYRKDRTLYGDMLMDIRKSWGIWSIDANLGGSASGIRDMTGMTSGNLKVPDIFSASNIDYSIGYKHDRTDTKDERSLAAFVTATAGWKEILYLTYSARNDWTDMRYISARTSGLSQSAGLSAVLSEVIGMSSWLSGLRVSASLTQLNVTGGRMLSSLPYANSFPEIEYAIASSGPGYFRSAEAGIHAGLMDCIDIDLTYFRSRSERQPVIAFFDKAPDSRVRLSDSGTSDYAGFEAAVSFSRRWNDFMIENTLSCSFWKNRINDISSGYYDPYWDLSVDPESYDINKMNETLSDKSAFVYLRDGGSLSGMYIRTKPVENGSTGYIVKEDIEPQYAGHMEPDGIAGWYSSIRWKGIRLAFTISARFGGKAYSITQAAADYEGTSETTAAARDKGYVTWNGNRYDTHQFYSGAAYPDYTFAEFYLYDATNIRLQELALDYDFPAKWFRNKAGLSVGFIGRNLWMIYCKAPFDPELASVPYENSWQGIDYFTMPSTRSIGFRIRLRF